MVQMRLRRNRFKNISHRNVFDKQLNFKIKTKFVTLLAPGRKGVEGYDFLEKVIPREDNTIIAVNFGVRVAREFDRPYLEPDIWMVSDTRAIEQVIEPDVGPWFPAALTEFKGQKIFALNVVERCWKELNHSGPYLSYASKNLMRGGDVAPKGYIIRSGGTILSAGVQGDNFWHEHPDKVTLICGGDMSADDYMRGKNTQKKHGETWPSVHCLGRVIKDRIRRGSNIFTISDTKLLDHNYIEYYPEYLLWRDGESEVVKVIDTTENPDALAAILGG